MEQGSLSKSITRSKEDYLRIIYELSKTKKNIRTSDVAEMLGITRASVSSMMSELKTGLIDKEKYGSISLTNEGYKLAEQIKDRYELIMSFLVDVLGVNKKVAKIDACKIEHALSQETAEKLNNQIRKHLRKR